MARVGNKFGWHSGILTVKGIKCLGDLYIQENIVFSDVSAGALSVTGGIDLTGTTSAIGIDLSGGTFSTGAVRIGDDTKLIFGAGNDASFEYDENGTDHLRYDGTDMVFDTATKLLFRDSGLHLYSSVDGQLDVIADTKLQLTAPTIDLEASSSIALDGDVAIDGAHTFATGTGDVSLNGDVTVAVDKDVVTSGNGYFQGVNAQLTNIKAHDGSACMVLTDSTGALAISAPITVSATGTALTFSADATTLISSTGSHTTGLSLIPGSGKTLATGITIGGGAGAVTTGISLLSGATAGLVIEDDIKINFGNPSGTADWSLAWENTNTRLAFTGNAAGVSNIRMGPRAQLKVHNRLGASSGESEGGNTIEVRARAVSAAIAHSAVDSIMYLRPDTTVTSGVANGLFGQLWVDTGKEITGSQTYLAGIRGQVYNDGTINGAGVCMSGIYSLLEKDGASAVWTSASQVANLWLDCHLESTPTTSNGVHFIVASNNGSAAKCTYNSVVKVFGEGAVTNLFNLQNCSGMVTSNTGTAPAGDGYVIKVEVEGNTLYLKAASAWS